MTATALRLCVFVFLAFWVIILLRLIKGNFLRGCIKAQLLAAWGEEEAKDMNTGERGAVKNW